MSILIYIISQYFQLKQKNLWKNNSVTSGLTTQILYGEKFKLIKKTRDWWKIKLNSDKYIGFIKKKKNLKEKLLIIIK